MNHHCGWVKFQKFYAKQIRKTIEAKLYELKHCTDWLNVLGNASTNSRRMLKKQQ
jgi:hypothetical protein